MVHILGVCGVGNNVRRDPSRTLVAEWWETLSEGIRRGGYPTAGLGEMRCVSFADMLETTGTCPGGAAGRFIRQIRAYVTDQEARDLARRQVAASITSDTHVLVGHSLGTVAAYEALCAMPVQPVRLLITMGCPLGFRRFIRDRLRVAPQGGRLPWPVGLRRWINLYDWWDPVAVTNRLRPLVGDGCQVEDFRVKNGLRAHAAAAYLSAPQLSRALIETLIQSPRQHVTALNKASSLSSGGAQ